MIVILKKEAAAKDIDSFVDGIKQRGLGVHISKGVDKTIIGLLGDTSKLSPEDFLANDIVESAERVSAPYKMASRSFHPENTVVTIGANQEGVIPCVIGDGKSLPVIAGPCSVETEEQILAAAQAVKKAGARILRGGAYKPRTSPYSFQGLGVEGIRLLKCSSQRQRRHQFHSDSESEHHVLLDGTASCHPHCGKACYQD